MVTPSRGTAHPVDASGSLRSDRWTRGWETPEGGSPASPEPTGRAPTNPVHLHPRALQAFGLSYREAKAYLALLAQGPMRARRATEGSGLQRATAYRVLGRLIARGLVTTQPGAGRLYHPLPLRVLVERNVAFLRDEIELRQWMLRVLPSGPVPDMPSRLGIPADRFASASFGEMDPPGSVPVEVTSMGSGSDSPLLQHLHSARLGVDALIRPLMIPAELRPKIAGSLVRTAARGLPVRVVLDYLAADRRFAAAVRRERSGRVPSMEVRHYTPLAGHCYVIDGRSAVRFPTLGGSSTDPDFGYFSRDVDFVRAQVARFEAVWEDGVARRENGFLSEDRPPLSASFVDRALQARRTGAGEIRAPSIGGVAGRLAHR